MSFEELLKYIRQGRAAKSSELLPYLCLEDSGERCETNLRFAEAYSAAGNFGQAKVFIERAWLLSQFSPRILPQYLSIHSALGDIESIRQAYKRLGMQEAYMSNVAKAL